MSRRLCGYATEPVPWWQRSELIQEIIEQFEQLRREKIAQGKPSLSFFCRRMFYVKSACFMISFRVLVSVV
jgi:hypothetical protein